ncbi:hypothetical protein MMC34_005173 [Xylographa carneopallida]|nr:hypothetical protein [Xylographa carneopallida]
MGKLLGFLERKLTQLKAGSETMVACLDNIISYKSNQDHVNDLDLPHKLRHQNEPLCSSASELSSAEFPFDPSAYELEADDDGVLVLKRTSGYSTEYHKHAKEQEAAPNPLGIISFGDSHPPEVAELEGDISHERKDSEQYTSIQGRPFRARPNSVDDLSQPSTSSLPHSTETLVLDPDHYAWPPILHGPGSPYLQAPRPSSTSVARLDHVIPPQLQAGPVIKRKPVPKPRLRASYLQKKPLPEIPSDRQRRSHTRSFRERIETFVGRPLSSLNTSADRISFHAAAGKDILCIFAEIDPAAPGFTNKVVAKILRGRSKQSGDLRHSNSSSKREADHAQPAERLRELRETVKRERMFLHISEPLLQMGEPFKITF